MRNFIVQLIFVAAMAAYAETPSSDIPIGIVEEQADSATDTVGSRLYYRGEPTQEPMPPDPQSDKTPSQAPIVVEETPLPAVKSAPPAGKAPIRTNTNTRARQQANRALVQAIAKGKGISAAGIALHFTGLGLGTLAMVDQTGYLSGPAAMLTVPLLVAGPIVGAAGASHVGNAAEDAGLTVRSHTSWRKFGIGGALMGGGLGFFMGGVLFAFSGGEAAAGSVIALGGAAMMVAGEVMWMMSTIQSRTYISEIESVARKQKIVWSIIPRFDLDGTAGAVLAIQF